MNMFNTSNCIIASELDTPITSVDSLVLTPKVLIVLAVIIVIAEAIPLVKMAFTRMDRDDMEQYRTRSMSRFSKALKHGKTLKPYWSSDGRFDNASMAARSTIMSNMKSRPRLGLYFNNEWRWLPVDALPVRWDHGSEAVMAAEDLISKMGSTNPGELIEAFTNSSPDADSIHMSYDGVDVILAIIGRTVVPVIIGHTDVDTTDLEIMLSRLVSNSKTRILIDSPVFIVNDENEYANHSKSVKSGVTVGIKTALCNLETMLMERTATDLNRKSGGIPEAGEIPERQKEVREIYNEVRAFIRDGINSD